MSEHAPSVADRWVAAHRARLEGTRPLTPRGDVAGELRLYRDVAGATPALGPAGALELRTRVVDAEVAHALGRGTDQVVLLFAGYDGRPLRFAGAGLRWYEVERPRLLADKARRLRALGIDTTASSEVAVADPSGALLGPALEAAGHDPDRPTLFVCEELALVETLEHTAGVLGALAARAAAGSTLVAGFEVAPEVAGVTRGLRALRDRLSGPGRDLYRPGDPEKLLVVTGWRVVRSESTKPGPLDTGTYAHVLVGEPAA